MSQKNEIKLLKNFNEKLFELAKMAPLKSFNNDQAHANLNILKAAQKVQKTRTLTRAQAEALANGRAILQQKRNKGG